MENKIILIDTSILIDYYLKTDKSNSIWVALVRQDYEFAISAITKYEIYCGATNIQIEFWDSILKIIEVIAFDEAEVNTAVKLNNSLKQSKNQIDIADLFIAATAVTHNLSLATLNRKHFARIKRLNIVEL